MKVRKGYVSNSSSSSWVIVKEFFKEDKEDMKVRSGYVSNSSSTSFLIRNLSKEKKTLIDFASETSYLCERFCEEYSSPSDYYNVKNLMSSAVSRQINNNGFTLDPGESIVYSFGDEDGDVIGQVFDYMLREGGGTESFIWGFKEYLR